MTPQSSVLAIWYTQNGVKHHHPQGKIFQNNGEWYFLVNVDKVKFIKKYRGYAIAQRIFEAFTNRQLGRVTIIFKDKDKHVSYVTNSTYMKDRGIYDNLGSHRQIVMPIDMCSPMQRMYVHDPKGLPVVDIEDWAKGIQEVYEYVDNTVIIHRVEPSQQMAFL